MSASIRSARDRASKPRQHSVFPRLLRDPGDRLRGFRNGRARVRTPVRLIGKTRPSAPPAGCAGGEITAPVSAGFRPAVKACVDEDKPGPPADRALGNSFSPVPARNLNHRATHINVQLLIEIINIIILIFDKKTRTLLSGQARRPESLIAFRAGICPALEPDPVQLPARICGDG